MNHADAAAASDRRTSPVELLWDLVFVFALTQVTTLLTRRPGRGPAAGRSMLVLALVWWAWSAFVWAANAEDGRLAPLLRAVLLGAAVLIFIAGPRDSSRVRRQRDALRGHLRRGAA